jgi:hypothetical protein
MGSFKKYAKVCVLMATSHINQVKVMGHFQIQPTESR